MISFHTTSATIISELDSVLAKISGEEIEAAIAVLRKAKTVVVAGVGREGLAARGFAMRLAHLGFDAHWVWDDTTPPLGDGDLLVTISGSGAIGHLDHVITLAQESCAKILVVTAVPTGISSRRADATIFIPAKTYKGTGDLVESIQPMGSLFEQAAGIVFDTVVLELEALSGQTHADLARRHRNVE